ncbi:Response regulator receiver domain-containing protein [Paucidesulfovibrio gracilis DSM 16080]|uniref:Response regulator receiver domain-containing protein n=1 Tax=Paucidesulfovibrio gracilis DSM 16080 TaxID=1121449 RepID=A0A1T4WT29_9BACT|nr:response regulator [Paucidesulfovibrio gracilis]SKA80005.1 Response regulator receiver domain-containing protein [Paucidesulfovibrio gracilis DSM 16080]
MSEKVLLVDDEKDFLESLSERMSVRGMNVSTAENPAEAMKAVDADSYDAIVLDLQMPEMNGIDLLKFIREKHPEMQVILLTGHATLEKGVQAMKLGAMDFMEKPADIDVLTDKIKKAQARKLVLVEKMTEDKIKEIMTTKGW